MQNTMYAYDLGNDYQNIVTVTVKQYKSQSVN